MILTEQTQTGEISSELLAQAQRYVDSYMLSANSWDEQRRQREAVLLARYATERSIDLFPSQQPTRQCFQTHLPKGRDGIRLLIDRQRPPATLLVNAVTALSEQLRIQSHDIVVCNVGAGTTNLPFEIPFADVMLIDPVYATVNMRKHPNAARGFRYVAEPFSLEHIVHDRPTIVTFEFSLHHIATKPGEIRDWIQAVASVPHVVGIVVMDYHLHAHPQEFLLQEFQTIFATMAERKEIQNEGIAGSLTSHTLPLFPIVEDTLGEKGFVQLEQAFFPHFDPSFGDVADGLSAGGLRMITSTKCSQIYIRPEQQLQ